jgi:outer membrane receptor protein involved in Fe transport
LSVPADSFWGSDYDKWEREAAGIDATFFFSGAGEHSLKIGGQYELIKNAVSYGEVGNMYYIRWGNPDRFGAGVQGTEGSLEARSYREFGAAESENWALFLQDSWQVVPNLTLNIGVRAERERVPTYFEDPTLPQLAMSWDFDEKLAPRLGFAWDVFSDAKLKVYGSYGTYYDITKLAMPRQSFGSAHWISYLYPLDSIDYPAITAACSTSVNDPLDNVCPHLGSPVSLDLRHPTDPRDAIDPDLQPMENRAYQLGAEYMLTPKIVLGARLVNKTLINTIEDIGFLSCEGTVCQETYITGNPGKGVVGGELVPGIPPQAEAIRDYQAVELTFNRRFANNWMLYATYVYSELTGNYSGLASSDEFGRNDPNIERYFDGLAYGYDSQGNIVDGVLNTDRPHAIEISGMYTVSSSTPTAATTWAGRPRSPGPTCTSRTSSGSGANSPWRSASMC